MLPALLPGPVGVAARLVTALVPSLKDRVERLLRAIEDSQPDCAEMVVCHGDYLVSQIVDGLRNLSRAGLDGVLLAWPRFEQGMREFRDVTYPLVKQAGLREFL